MNHTPITRAYLRASTNEQDANRARAQLEEFADQHGMRIEGFCVENESGASLRRPELFKLLGNSRPGDILLVEQVDRLSRLNAIDWEKLRMVIKSKGVRIVALDLPTSYAMASTGGDETTGRMFAAINEMMLDMLAAIARKDYEDRRRRQAQGIAKAKAGGKFRGRQEDTARNAALIAMLKSGQSWKQITLATGASSSTLARLRARIDQQEA